MTQLILVFLCDSGQYTCTIKISWAHTNTYCMQLPIIKHEFPRQSLRYKLITTLNEMSAETMELAKNYTQKRFVDLVRNNIVNGYRNTCVDPRNCYTCNNS